MKRCWLPGWQFSAAAFTPLMRALGAEDEVILSFSGEHGLTRQQWVEHQALAITEPSTLVGWSLGGMLAVEIAALNPLVTRIQLLNTNVKFAGDSGLPTAIAEKFMQRYQRQPDSTRKRFATLVDRQNAAELSELLLASNELSTLHWLYDIDLQTTEVRADINVMLSLQDQLVPYQAATQAWQQKGFEVTLLPGEHSLPIVDPNSVASWMVSHG